MKKIGTKFALQKYDQLVDIILNSVYNMWIMFIFLVCTIVIQNGDTLFFVQDSTYFDTLVMHEYFIDGMKSLHSIERAKVSPDGRTYLIYSAGYTANMPETLLATSIAFYDEAKNKLLEEKAKGERNISYDLSTAHDSLFVVATWDKQYGEPAVYVFKDGKRQDVIKKGDWQRIVSYKISPNSRYFLFHTRNPYHGKPWDYIYFYDLESGKNWDYIFPTCLSCKKSRIDLELDENGRSTVIHKQEHRVFSREGYLEDIYLKIK